MKVTRRTLARLLVVAFVVNLVVMAAGAAMAYEKAPPIPAETVGPDGEQITTRSDIREGKAVFQRDGLLLGDGVAAAGTVATVNTFRLQSVGESPQCPRRHQSTARPALSPVE